MTHLEIEEHIYNFPHRNAWGFSSVEIEEVLKAFPKINMDKFNDALTGNTCMKDEAGNLITYPHDLLKAIICGVENRNLSVEEWD